MLDIMIDFHFLSLTIEFVIMPFSTIDDIDVDFLFETGSDNALGALLDLSADTDSASTVRYKRKQTTRQRGRAYSAQTKEVLTAWARTNWDNPYPSAEEKQMFAIEFGLTLDQIHIWFSHYRARVWRKKATPSETMPSESYTKVSESTPSDAKASETKASETKALDTQSSKEAVQRTKNVSILPDISRLQSEINQLQQKLDLRRKTLEDLTNTSQTKSTTSA
jgi:Homeobox KN domain